MFANRLLTATREDDAAKLDAFQAGLLACKPFSAGQLAHLCGLGEVMMYTALRKSDAERDVHEATTQMRRTVDIRLDLSRDTERA
jgi:hypothetical protein